MIAAREELAADRPEPTDPMRGQCVPYVQVRQSRLQARQGGVRRVPIAMLENALLDPMANRTQWRKVGGPRHAACEARVRNASRFRSDLLVRMLPVRNERYWQRLDVGHRADEQRDPGVMDQGQVDRQR